MAEKTLGTILKKGTTVIGGVTSIGQIGAEADEIDVTNLSSPDGYKEFLPGLKDGGEVAIKGIVNSDSQLQDLISTFEGQTTESWEVDFPSGSKWTFSGFLKSVKEGEITPEGKREFEISIRMSGKPTFTPAA